MAQTIIMPTFGQTVEECELVKWLKKEGDTITKGELLFEIETDKAVLEVESFVEGTLLKILVREGETVPVKTVVAFVGEPGEALPEVKAPAPRPKPKAAALPSVAKAPTSMPVASPTPAAVAEPARFVISPRAAKLAREKVIDPTRIVGTGPNGRVVERDVLAYLDAQGYDRLRVTLAAKKLAAKEGIDLLGLDSLGESGRVDVAEVKRAVAERPRPMSKRRRIIAERLSESYRTIPHFFTTVSADLTALLLFKQAQKDEGVSLSVTDFIARAVVLALEDFPEVNCTTDGKSIRLRGRVHLGIAVAHEDGLVVPVVRGAGELSLAELHDAAARLVEKARDGKLLPEEMTGSTFTISNMGMLDVENFTAIINPGESAILAVSSVIETPVVREEAIVVRSMMKMTLSADHRVIDGAAAARFVNAIRNRLEDMALWTNMMS